MALLRPRCGQPPRCELWASRNRGRVPWCLVLKMCAAVKPTESS